MLQVPPPTAFDLRWRMFGIAVRVHPTFWLFMGFMGWNYERYGIGYLALWVVCGFVSILVHELGHVCMGLLFGRPGNIVLYSFGGLAIGEYQLARPWQRIAIYFAGPAAGLGLYGLVLLFDRYLYNHIDPTWSMLYLRRALEMLFFMNLFWNLLNLLPVFPLDGGQILREVCMLFSRRNGFRISLGLGFLCAGTIAVYSLIVKSRPELPYPPLEPTFTVIMFAILAFINLQAMNSLAREQRHWEYPDGE